MLVMQSGPTDRRITENSNAYKTDSYNVCRMYATSLKRISTSFEHIDPYSSILLLSYVDGGVILCGGRSRTVLHGDCLRFLLLGFCSFLTCSYSYDFFGLTFFMMSFQIRLEYRDMDQPQRHASGDFRFSSKEKEDMFTKPDNYRKGENRFLRTTR